MLESNMCCVHIAHCGKCHASRYHTILPFSDLPKEIACITCHNLAVMSRPAVVSVPKAYIHYQVESGHATCPNGHITGHFSHYAKPKTCDCLCPQCLDHKHNEDVLLKDHNNQFPLIVSGAKNERIIPVRQGRGAILDLVVKIKEATDTAFKVVDVTSDDTIHLVDGVTKQFVPLTYSLHTQSDYYQIIAQSASNLTLRPVKVAANAVQADMASVTTKMEQNPRFHEALVPGILLPDSEQFAANAMSVFLCVNDGSDVKLVYPKEGGKCYHLDTHGHWMMEPTVFKMYRVTARRTEVSEETFRMKITRAMRLLVGVR